LVSTKKLKVQAHSTQYTESWYMEFTLGLSPHRMRDIKIARRWISECPQTSPFTLMVQEKGN